VQLFQIKQVQVLPIALAEAWTFFCDPRNLGAITPDWLCFDIRSEVPPCMYPGLIIEYRIKALAGLPMSWVTEITHVVAPNYFVDEQRFGPYRFWHQQHHFREVNEGVEMIDIVHYAMPYASSALPSTTSMSSWKDWSRFSSFEGISSLRPSGSLQAKKMEGLSALLVSNWRSMCLSCPHR